MNKEDELIKGNGFSDHLKVGDTITFQRPPKFKLDIEGEYEVINDIQLLENT